ncbi:MAG: hypothetical protein M1826_003612 [Phylliscum demangeonii]|nr:MAG: hypothetical protein M1826_003612 [Phylliscum demangeonii]
MRPPTSAGAVLAVLSFARFSAVHAQTAASAQTTAADRTPRCCSALASALPAKVFYAADGQYQRSIASYWALQEQLAPNCIVIPTSTNDVATAVTILADLNSYRLRTGPKACQFAIRGGGHTPWAGAANIQRGVTIDLTGMKSVTLSADRTVAAVGPGATWQQVYDTLDALGVAVGGGRASGVGVAGLTLGGGNSFFAARYGLVCDNVKNFEIVLGTGQVVNANASSHPDLFQVLKGGSNNFGVVTRFDLIAFDQGPLWGGVVVYPESTSPRQTAAFVDFNNQVANDPYASLITFYSHNTTLNSTIIGNCYEYTKPIANPPPFANLTAIQPTLANTMRIANLSNLVAELDTPYSINDIFTTLTFANDPRMLTYALSVSNAALEPFKSSPDLNWVTMFQPLPRIITDHGIKLGGNVLGLDRTPGNLVLFQLFISWSDSTSYQALYAAARSVVSKMDAYARRIGAHNDWIYLNYATQDQDPLSSYGPANVKKLQAASAKYDPGQVFQNLVPGGYKIKNVHGERGLAVV